MVEGGCSRSACAVLQKGKSGDEAAAARSANECPSSCAVSQSVIGSSGVSALPAVGGPAVASALLFGEKAVFVARMVANFAASERHAQFSRRRMSWARQAGRDDMWRKALQGDLRSDTLSKQFSPNNGPRHFAAVARRRRPEDISAPWLSLPHPRLRRRFVLCGNTPGLPRLRMVVLARARALQLPPKYPKRPPSAMHNRRSFSAVSAFVRIFPLTLRASAQSVVRGPPLRSKTPESLTRLPVTWSRSRRRLSFPVKLFFCWASPAALGSCDSAVRLVAPLCSCGR